MTPDEWITKIIRDLAFKAPELWDGYLRVSLQTAIRQNLASIVDVEQYVVVTVVEDGPVHVYSRPEPMDKATARKLERAMVKSDAQMYPDADRSSVRFCVRKVLADADPISETMASEPTELITAEQYAEPVRTTWGGDELIGPEEPE